jgi:hypothetical protein
MLDDECLDSRLKQIYIQDEDPGNNHPQQAANAHDQG